MLRTGWQRLTALLAAIANWRFFKPAVFAACAVPAAHPGVQVLPALAVEPGGRARRGSDQDARARNGRGRARRPAGDPDGHADPPDLQGQSCPDCPPHARRLGVRLRADARDDLSGLRSELLLASATCQYADVWADLLKRKFIFVGMVSFSILLVLAITSTGGWVRRLKKRWVTLHRLVYVAAVAGVDPLHLDPEVGHQRAAEVGVLARPGCWGFACFSPGRSARPQAA